MSEGLSINRLYSFLEVVDATGFTLAAPRDPVRQSQLSRQVGELERYFGKELFQRRGRGVVVTPAGERLATLVRELRKGFAEVKAEPADAPLPYSFGAGDSLLQWWVVPRIGDVTRQVPQAVASLVSLSSSDVVTQLLDARLEFGLVRANEVPKGLESRPIGRLEYALYVPRKLRGRAREVDELLARVPLALQQSEPELNERLLALAGKHGKPTVALACETFPQACSAVRSEKYAALLPTIVDDALADSKAIVKMPLVGLGRLAAKLHLAWHPRTTRRNDKLASLAHALEECLRLDQS